MKKLFVLTLSLFLFLFVGVSFLTVHASSNISVTVNGIFDNHNEAETQGSYAYGTKLSLAPTIPSGHEFAFWIVNGVVREDLAINYNFTVTNRLNLQAVFNREGKVAVVFIDSNGEYLGVKYANENGSVDDTGIPTPTRPGYQIANPKWASVFGASSLSVVDGNSVFAIQYQTDASISDKALTVVDGSGTGSYPFNTVVSVVADAPGVGEEFSHWEENNKIVSHSSSYTFTLLKTRTLTAIFQETAVSEAPLVTMSDDLALRAGYESYYGQYFVPAGYEVIEYGFLASKSSDQLTINSAGVVVAQSSSRNTYFEFVTSFVENDYRSFRAYMVVKQGEGAPTYVYSEVYFRDPVPTPTEISTGFEDATKASYTTGNVTSNGNEWILNDTLIGNSTADLKNNTKSARMRNFIQTVGKINGLTSVSFSAGIYGTDGASTIDVQLSLDQSTWVSISDGVTGGNLTLQEGALTQFEIILNNSSTYLSSSLVNQSVYFRIVKLTGNRINIDDIFLSSNFNGPIHEVEFNSDGILTYELVSDGGVITEPNPSKTGYTFDGWYLEEALTNPHNNAAITQSITLYAKFITTVYNITYQLNSGTNHIDNPATYTYFDDEIPLSNPSRDYYTFDGWYDNIGLTGTPVTSIPTNSSGDITLYAKWSPVSYNITYNLDGGTNNVGNPSSYNVETSTITLLDPSKDGFIFDGWYDNSGFTGEEVEFIELGSNGNKALYAKWTEVIGEVYVVSFDVTGVDNPQSQNVQENGTATEPTTTGIRYEWYSDTGKTITYNFTTQITADVTIYGKAFATTLLISEYIEGSSNNKAIEIYNGTGSAVDLSSYSIKLYANGANTATNTQVLSGTLEHGEVFVIANSASNASILAIADLTSAVANFNGDDAIELLLNGNVVDSIGQVGFDPGSRWGTSPTSTENNTLVRKVNIIIGRSISNVVFNPSEEWNGFATDYLDDLGSHTVSWGE